MTRDDQIRESVQGDTSDNRTLAGLANPGPEVQGDIDETLLLAILALKPLQRIQAASETGTQIEKFRIAVNEATHV